jgi:murein DD-endopeptidase MepM/ murein hydrolase activator NlpD
MSKNSKNWLGNRLRLKLLPTTFLALSLALAACAPDPSLWGDLSTPTPNGTPQLPGAVTYDLVATITPTASVTPLVVLPLPGTATPGSEPMPTLPPVNTAGPLLLIKASSGDTLDIVAKRAGVSPAQIVSDVVLPPADALLKPGTLLLVPDILPKGDGPAEPFFPDSEFVYSPSAADFDANTYVSVQNGALAAYREYLMSKAWTTGAEAVQRIALDNSLNPRLLLAIIEYESRWVRGQPASFAQDEYPLGYVDYHYRGLFRQLMWAAGELSVGYYGWRAGTLNEISFPDGSTLRLSPKLNASSAGLMYFFAKLHNRPAWDQAVNSIAGLQAEMFGDPWARAAAVEPLFPPGLAQPELSLPFEPGKVWSFSGGPHSAWERQGALAALDFAPAAAVQGCVDSDHWILAPASGQVVRVDEGVVILDLDDDGREQTGWVMLFLHVATAGKAELGEFIPKDGKIGHPSCEGGVSTGTHVHIARKYNGEWILAEGPLAFNLDGWIARNGQEPYKGWLARGDQSIEACTCGTFETRIKREKP